jgi:hypothetical protein
VCVWKKDRIMNRGIFQWRHFNDDAGPTTAMVLQLKQYVLRIVQLDIRFGVLNEPSPKTAKKAREIIHKTKHPRFG